MPDCATDALGNTNVSLRIWFAGYGEGNAEKLEGIAGEAGEGALCASYSHAESAAEVTQRYPWARIPCVIHGESSSVVMREEEVSSVLAAGEWNVVAIGGSKQKVGETETKR